jgi:hypothetical protein
MAPTTQNVHVDALLTDYSRRYRNGSYVGLQIMPLKQVTKLSDEFARYSMTEQFTIPDTTHGFKDLAKEVSWSIDTDNYSCKPHALKDYVSDYEQENADEGIDPRVDTTEFLTDQLQLAHESAVATLLTTAGTWGANTAALTGDDKWDSGKAAATPIADVKTAIQACVVRPNIGVTTPLVMDVLSEDATINDKIKYTSGGPVTAEMIARILGLDRLIVADAQGYVGGTLQYLWGKNFVLAHVEPPRPKSIQVGLTFSTKANQIVRTWSEPARGGGSIAIEVNWNYDHKIVCTDVGYLLRTVIS